MVGNIDQQPVYPTLRAQFATSRHLFNNSGQARASLLCAAAFGAGIVGFVAFISHGVTRRGSVQKIEHSNSEAARLNT